MNFFNGFLRVVIAMISGVVAYLLIESKIVFSFLGDQSSGNGYLIVAFLSGFSERFIPNIMNTWSSKGNGKTQADYVRPSVSERGKQDQERSKRKAETQDEA